MILYFRFRQGVLETKVRLENSITNKQLLFYKYIFQGASYGNFSTETHSQKKTVVTATTTPRRGQDMNSRPLLATSRVQHSADN